jgi:putative membrane protein
MLEAAKESIKLVAIGMVMGAAEVVPGVSGGTIAFITGIYERLINSVRQFTPYLFIVLKNHGIKTVWRRVDASFLLTLFCGMGLAIILFANAVGYLLRNEPILIWSFFCGLVIASVWIVYKQISRMGLDLVLACCAGAAVGIVVTNLVPVQLAPTPLFIFLGGAVAVCAWILPGLSGSFILLVLGLYAVVIDAIEQFDIVTLSVLGAGCAIGLVSFSQVLSRLFRYFRDETLAVLTGFMLGSLVKLWPWKNTLSYQLREDGSRIPLIQEPVLPQVYAEMTGNDAQLLVALTAALVGFVIVILLGRFSSAES